MSSLALIEASINRMPADQRPPLMEAFREAIKQIRVGAPSLVRPPMAVPAENFGGHLVPFMTASSANVEFAVPHQLGRVARLVLPALNVGVPGSVTVSLLVTRPADATYLYLSCPVASVNGLLYVE